MIATNSKKLLMCISEIDEYFIEEAFKFDIAAFLTRKRIIRYSAIAFVALLGVALAVAATLLRRPSERGMA